MHFTLRPYFAILGLAIFLVSHTVLAQTAVIHPWIAPRTTAQAQAYFVNLRDGDRVEMPMVVQFGLSGGWGLAPIDAPMLGKSGHHHLLVNRDLPLDFKKPLPFNEQYIHFGKGQMETVLNLQPGTYSLRMLLADDKHLPHFVYSKPTQITVTQRRNVEPKSLQTQGVRLLSPKEGEALRNPVLVRFHAAGYPVAHVGQKLKGTGHFRLRLQPQGAGQPVDLNFSNGQTEAYLQPPPGSYTATLLLVDNLAVDKILAQGPAQRFSVQN